MRTTLLSFSLLATLAAGCKTTYCEACATAQTVVESVATKHPDVTRLTVHCGQADGTNPKACASTSADKRGKPSDPEDLKAMQSGETVVLDEAGAFDVTVPILAKDGKWAAACGVTLKAAATTREQAKAQAAMIAKEVEAGLGTCCANGCCCK